MSRSEVSTGGVILRRRSDQPEVCLILDRYGVWTFPKGKVEPGETPLEAALREVAEEVSLRAVQVLAELGVTGYRFPRGEDVIRKSVAWFLMEAAADAEVIPSRGQGVQDAGWFSLREALEMIGYGNLRPVLRRAQRAAQQSGLLAGGQERGGGAHETAGEEDWLVQRRALESGKRS